MDEEDDEMPGKVWKWEVWPHPYDSYYDCYATDDDGEALEAILHAAEMHLWDSNDGGERVLRVVHNGRVDAWDGRAAAGQPHSNR